MELRIKGVKEMKKLQSFSQGIAQKALNRTIEKFAFTLQGRLTSGYKSITPLGVSGRLRRSFITQKAGNSWFIHNITSYSQNVHEGTPPQNTLLRDFLNRSLGGEKFNSLKTWSEKKGIPLGALIFTLAKKGQRAQPFFSKVLLDAKIKKSFLKIARREIISTIEKAKKGV